MRNVTLKKMFRGRLVVSFTLSGYVTGIMDRHVDDVTMGVCCGVAKDKSDLHETCLFSL